MRLDQIGCLKGYKVFSIGVVLHWKSHKTLFSTQKSRLGLNNIKHFAPDSLFIDKTGNNLHLTLTKLLTE